MRREIEREESEGNWERDTNKEDQEKVRNYCSNCVNLHKFNLINSIIWENFGLNAQKVPIFFILHSTDVNA